MKIENYHGTLHVHGQSGPHDTVYIAGTRDALIALRDALSRAIAEGQATVNSFVNDGEGFAVEIRRPQDMGGYGRPYSNEVYVDHSDDVTWPWSEDTARSRIKK